MSQQQAIVQSPFTRRALAAELPAKDLSRYAPTRHTSEPMGLSGEALRITREINDGWGTGNAPLTTEWCRGLCFEDTGHTPACDAREEADAAALDARYAAW